jgi:hypothetical protein
MLVSSSCIRGGAASARSVAGAAMDRTLRTGTAVLLTGIMLLLIMLAGQGVASAHEATGRLAPLPERRAARAAAPRSRPADPAAVAQAQAERRRFPELMEQASQLVTELKSQPRAEARRPGPASSVRRGRGDRTAAARQPQPDAATTARQGQPQGRRGPPAATKMTVPDLAQARPPKPLIPEDTRGNTQQPEPGGPEPGGPQAGGPQAGGPQAGGPQAGDPQAGDPQAGGPDLSAFAPSPADPPRRAPAPATAAQAVRTPVTTPADTPAAELRPARFNQPPPAQPTKAAGTTPAPAAPVHDAAPLLARAAGPATGGAPLGPSPDRILAMTRRLRTTPPVDDDNHPNEPFGRNFLHHKFELKLEGGPLLPPEAKLYAGLQVLNDLRNNLVYGRVRYGPAGALTYALGNAPTALLRNVTSMALLTDPTFEDPLVNTLFNIGLNTWITYAAEGAGVGASRIFGVRLYTGFPGKIALMGAGVNTLNYLKSILQTPEFEAPVYETPDGLQIPLKFAPLQLVDFGLPPILQATGETARVPNPFHIMPVPVDYTEEGRPVWANSGDYWINEVYDLAALWLPVFATMVWETKGNIRSAATIATTSAFFRLMSDATNNPPPPGDPLLPMLLGPAHLVNNVQQTVYAPDSSNQLELSLSALFNLLEAGGGLAFDLVARNNPVTAPVLWGQRFWYQNERDHPAHDLIGPEAWADARSAIDRAAGAWARAVEFQPQTAAQATDDLLLEGLDLGRNGLTSVVQWTRRFLDLGSDVRALDAALGETLDRAAVNLKHLQQSGRLLLDETVAEFDRLRLEPDPSVHGEHLGSHILNLVEQGVESVKGLVTGDPEAWTRAAAAAERADQGWDRYVTFQPTTRLDRAVHLLANFIDAVGQTLGWTAQQFNSAVWDPVKSDAPPEEQISRHERRVDDNLARMEEDVVHLWRSVVGPAQAEAPIPAPPGAPPAPATPQEAGAPEPLPSPPEEPAVEQASAAGSGVPDPDQPADPPRMLSTRDFRLHLELAHTPLPDTGEGGSPSAEPTPGDGPTITEPGTQTGDAPDPDASSAPGAGQPTRSTDAVLGEDARTGADDDQATGPDTPDTGGGGPPSGTPPSGAAAEVDASDRGADHVESSPTDTDTTGDDLRARLDDASTEGGDGGHEPSATSLADTTPAGSTGPTGTDGSGSDTAAVADTGPDSFEPPSEPPSELVWSEKDLGSRW